MDKKEDLFEAADRAKSSDNYNFVAAIDNMISFKAQPFYVSFGNEAEVIKNIAFITDADPSFMERLTVTFFLDPDKLLKGTIISIPDCLGEMDSLYYAIVFEGNTPIRYNCELIENDLYCLRKNNEVNCHLFDSKPQIEDIWSIVQSSAPTQEDGKCMALLTQDGREWFYMIFDKNDERLLNHWLGTTEFTQRFFNRDGVNYVLVSGVKEAHYFMRFDKENESFIGVQLNDKNVVQQLDVLSTDR